MDSKSLPLCLCLVFLSLTAYLPVAVSSFQTFDHFRDERSVDTTSKRPLRYTVSQSPKPDPEVELEHPETASWTTPIGKTSTISSRYQKNLKPGASSSSGSPVLNVENLGDIHNYAVDGPAGPMHVFNTDQPNLLVGSRVISFSEDGTVSRATTLEYANNSTVVAVDSHTLPQQEATFVAIAQESSSGPGNVVSVYLVSTENQYSLFTRVQTNSSITAMKLYSDSEGNIMLAMAQRFYHCTTNWDSECGLSLIYKLCGSGDTEISSVVQTGNATNVKLAESSQSVSLMYSTCETDENQTQTCKIINHFERPGMMPLNYYEQFSCDPSSAEIFNMYGYSYYLGPSPSCDKHQISLWNDQMDFLNTFNTFDRMPDSWFVVDAGYSYCDASLVMAGVGKEGTTYYSLTTPGADYTELLHDPTMAVGQMWSSGGNIYCVNKSAESLTLFKMYCPNSYIGQTTAPTGGSTPIPVSRLNTTTLGPSNTESVPHSSSETESSVKLALEIGSSETPVVQTSSATEHSFETPGETSVVTDSTTQAKTTTKVLAVVADQTSTVPVEHATLLPSGQTTYGVDDFATVSHVPEVSGSSALPVIRIGQISVQLESVSYSSTCTVTGAIQPDPLELLSKFSTIVEVKGRSWLIIPPTERDQCYQLRALGFRNVTGVVPISSRKFCNPTNNILEGTSLRESKAAGQYGSGNIYTVSSYGTALEFTSLIKGNAVFDVIRENKAGVLFTSLTINICEGFATVCATAETCSGKDCSTEVRCFRMFKLKWLAVLSINTSKGSRVHLETYLKSKSCMLLVESPKGSLFVRAQIYKVKSSVKGLDVAPAGKIKLCAQQQLQTMSLQRGVWFIASTMVDNSACSSSLLETMELPDRLLSRASLDFDVLSSGTAKHLTCCGGNLVIMVSNTTKPSMHSYVVSSTSQDVEPASHNGLPVGFSGAMTFFTVNSRHMVLLKYNTTGVILQLTCSH